MQRPPRKDVFLDFLSPDNNELYGTYANYARNKERHLELLEQGLNIAVQLCGDQCLLPPFFPLQCEMARAALQKKAEYLISGFIRLPVREASLGDFIDKKVAEYSRVRSSYPGLYDPSAQEFVTSRSQAVLKRAARMGTSIASRWEAGPDESPLWKPVLALLPASTIEDLRKIPQWLKENGESVTWAGMQPHLPPLARRAEFELNQVLQHEYTAVYLMEYDATIISRLPPKTTDLLLLSADPSYDYYCWKGALGGLGLWPILPLMGAGDVVRLKYCYGYLELLTAFHDVCLHGATPTDVRMVFAAATFGQSSVLTPMRRRLERIAGAVQQGGPLTREQLEVLDSYLFQSSAAVRGIAFQDIRSPRRRTLIRSDKEVASRMPTVFLVHGRDHTVRDKINLFLRDKGLKVVVLEEAAWGGQTIPEKFEKIAATTDYVVVVATPDDILVEKATDKEITRLRQNVVLEIGYFWGAFGRKGRFSLLLGDPQSLDLPTDMSGLGYILITEDLGQTKLALEKELHTAGLLP
jgi:predicted nucleotide-binding protein